MEAINRWIKAVLFTDFHVTGERDVSAKEMQAGWIMITSSLCLNIYLCTTPEYIPDVSEMRGIASAHWTTQRDS